MSPGETAFLTGVHMGSRRLAVIASASFLAACVEGGRVDPSGMLQALEVPEPIGTFESEAKEPGQLLRLVLMADGTSHIEELAVCRLRGFNCDPVKLDSLYERSGTASAGHLELMDGIGLPVRIYDYQHDGTYLAVLKQGGTDWQTLVRAPIAWCAVKTQCDQQWLIPPPCFGSWACIDNGCQYSCRQ